MTNGNPRKMTTERRARGNPLETATGVETSVSRYNGCLRSSAFTSHMPPCCGPAARAAATSWASTGAAKFPQLWRTYVSADAID